MLENSQHMQQLLSKIGNTYVNDVTSQGVSMATPGPSLCRQSERRGKAHKAQKEGAIGL